MINLTENERFALADMEITVELEKATNKIDNPLPSLRGGLCGGEGDTPLKVFLLRRDEILKKYNLTFEEYVSSLEQENN